MYKDKRQTLELKYLEFPRSTWEGKNLNAKKQTFAIGDFLKHAESMETRD